MNINVYYKYISESVCDSNIFWKQANGSFITILYIVKGAEEIE